MGFDHRPYLPLLLIFLTLSACSGKRGPGIVLIEPGSIANVCRVAVLPFVDEAKDRGIDQLSSRIFRNELVNSNLFIVESEGDLRIFMAQKKLVVSDFMETRTRLYQELGAKLRVDAVVRGTIIKSGIDKTVIGAPVPFITLKLELIDTRTGKLLMDTFHRRRGDDYRKLMHVGIVGTKTGLMVRVAAEIIQTWKKNGAEKCQN